MCSKSRACSSPGRGLSPLSLWEGKVGLGGWSFVAGESQGPQDYRSHKLRFEVRQGRTGAWRLWRGGTIVCKGAEVYHALNAVQAPVHCSLHAPQTLKGSIYYLLRFQQRGSKHREKSFSQGRTARKHQSRILNPGELTSEPTLRPMISSWGERRRGG